MATSIQYAGYVSFVIVASIFGGATYAMYLAISKDSIYYLNLGIAGHVTAIMSFFPCYIMLLDRDDT